MFMMCCRSGWKGDSLRSQIHSQRRGQVQPQNHRLQASDVGNVLHPGVRPQPSLRHQHRRQQHPRGQGGHAGEEAVRGAQLRGPQQVRGVSGGDRGVLDQEQQV